VRVGGQGAKGSRGTRQPEHERDSTGENTSVGRGFMAAHTPRPHLDMTAVLVKKEM
jgi:hypothetical protein